ncbi:MAG: Gfo/Idh/MocA family oxidoreductase [Planctomycetota bacterium]
MSYRSSRRVFLGCALAGGVSTTLLGTSVPAADERVVVAKPRPLSRKIKLGLIGCGGRGPWLAELFKQHGGYELHAVADYFDQSAQQVGNRLGVEKTRRFSGLEGYKRLLQSGLEAVAVVNIPRFHAVHARAAIDAGCHVYAAKPVAIDVPSALAVQAAGKLATQKKLCYLVDYQMATDPVNIEVVRRVHEGGVGRLMHIESMGISPPWSEPRVNGQEDRLRAGCWLSTIALSGDVITENNIHIINAVLWLVGRRPVRASGHCRVCRRNPRDDFREVYHLTYEFDDGLLWTHVGQSLSNQEDWALDLKAYGETATAVVNYRGKSYLHGGPKHYGARNIVSLYDQGAIRNISTFYDNVLQSRCDNPTVSNAVDDVLTAVLGREAAARRKVLSMEDLLQENKESVFDLSGLRR